MTLPSLTWRSRENRGSSHRACFCFTKGWYWPLEELKGRGWSSLTSSFTCQSWLGPPASQIYPRHRPLRLYFETRSC